MPPAPGVRPIATDGKAGQPARAAALRLLSQVLDDSRPLDDAGLDNGLAPRDRAFARLMAAATLRRMGQIDDIVSRYVQKPLPNNAAAIRHVLRLGAAQLLFLDVPAHAVLDTAVALAKKQPGRYGGLVNAVLRRVANEGPALVAAQDAARLNTPDWLWESWVTAYGAETARAIAAAHLEDPPLDLTVTAENAAWAERLNATRLPTGTLRRGRAGGRVEDLPGYEDGAWWVQDAAAALPVRLLGDVAGKSVIDLCAAPGGKSAQLAAAGARVTAVDRSAARLERLRDNLARLKLSADIVMADATAWRPPEPADAVLLDAPCSSTGTIRRHPDIPRLKRRDEIAGLTAVQDTLLAAAVGMVRPGGTVVYCTWSLQPVEGEARIAALLECGAPVDPVPVEPGEIPGLEDAARDGFLRTLPCHWADRGGLDGFFAARLRRR